MHHRVLRVVVAVFLFVQIIAVTGSRVGAAPQECVFFEECVFAELTNLYSLALYRECRLSLLVPLSGPGSVAVNCVDRSGQTLQHERELSRPERETFNQLIVAATPFAGEYVGADLRAVDGPLAMLRVGLAKKTAVLVASGNQSFQEEGPRMDLLTFLQRLQQDLLDHAQPPAQDYDAQATR